MDAACAELGLPTAWLMEAAGWQLARHCRGRTVVVCGTGNNGGDGLAAARHLLRWGRLQAVSCTDRGRLRGLAAEQAGLLERLDVEIAAEPPLAGAQVILDCLLGTGVGPGRPPSGPVADAIERINRHAATSRVKVVAADLPSGLEADTGAIAGVAVRAGVTVTLGLPKLGLRLGSGPQLAGEVWLADIGVPDPVYRRLGIEVPAHLFSMHDRVALGALSG